MQRGIIPGQAVLVGQRFEPADIALRKAIRELLIRWVAVVHAAPQRPAVACRAVPARILPGARVAQIQWPARLGRAFQQEPGLERRDEERVPVLLETAAAATQLADRPELSDFRVELRV